MRKVRFQSPTFRPCLSTGASRCRKSTVSLTVKFEDVSVLFSDQFRIAFNISSRMAPSGGFDVMSEIRVCSSICFCPASSSILCESRRRSMQMLDASFAAVVLDLSARPFLLAASAIFSLAKNFKSLTKSPENVSR